MTPSLTDPTQTENTKLSLPPLLLGVVEWRKGQKQRFIWLNEQLHPYRLEPWDAPVNYGCLPNTRNPADNAEIDAVWLGEPLEVGQQIRAQASGLLHLQDGDHKVVFGEYNEDSEDLQKLLEWFPAERGASLLGVTELWNWLQQLGVTSQ